MALDFLILYEHVVREYESILLLKAELARRGVRPDCIVVDPPRKGMSPDAIDAMVSMQPPRIVYVSCDPATLARDVKRMEEQGYVLQRAEAVDLFPRTAHVETVCLLSKLKY